MIQAHHLKTVREESQTAYEPEFINSQRNWKTDKITYIFLFVQKGCVFPKMFHCPVNNNKQLNCRSVQRDEVAMHQCSSLTKTWSTSTLTVLFWHHCFTRLLFLMLWSPVAMAVMTERSSYTETVIMTLRCVVVLPSMSYKCNLEILLSSS